MSSKLIMCKGLPGSGKSTWAGEEVKRICAAGGLACVVNKDSIRRELEEKGWTWSREREKDVEAERDLRIENGLKHGFTVISDDTNFARKHKVRLEQLARANGATLEQKSFLDVPLEVCLERNSKREGKARVPDKVITDMFEQFVKPQLNIEVRKYEPDHSKPKAIICDLDGTLADFRTKGHRGPFDAEKCDEDDVNWAVASCIDSMSFDGYEVIFLSGREDKYRPQTLTFLKKVGHWHTKPLFMRATGDFRKDWIVKAELFDAHIRDNYDVVFALDDRDQVVKMWRKMGLTCFQVAEGAF